ncbi:MAG: hypothetical protein IJH64_09845 [Oscillospiraceae bacterium]|nr:hypothetical protein [Oscillospiraceae bacterium]
MNISAQTIQDIKHMVPTVQVIEHYTHQQPARGRYLCPFHQDRHPSLTVKDGHWQCWSCGEHGDVIDFVMKYFGIGFQDAVCRISNDFGLDIDPPDIKDTNPEEALWRKILVECSIDNRRQITGYRQDISAQIDTLTACHRVLMQHGAPEDVLKKYCQEIDDLLEEEAFWR